MMRRKGFTLVEVMIVVAILGILGAIVMPVYQGNTSQAKDSAIRSNLHAFRAQIELYKMQHNAALPGYVNGAAAPVATLALQFIGTTTVTGAANPSRTPSNPFLCGPYMIKIPENPFNGLNTISYVALATAFSAAADGTSSGWLYKKETGEIRVNWTGADAKGVNYYDY